MSEFRTESDVDVPAFIREAFAGYVTALLWTATWEGDTGEAPEGYSNSDIELTEDQRALLLQDLVDFIVTNHTDCGQYAWHVVGRDAYSAWECLGHDFALTRNHHGAGFWDRGLGDLGGRLTKASHPYGTEQIVAYVDEDEICVEVTS